MDHPRSTLEAFRAPLRAGINPLWIFRAATRCVGLLSVFGTAAMHYALTVPFIPKRDRLRGRARWLQRWSRHCARAIGMRIEQHGTAPSSGMIVSNHLSYLDILAFSAITPCVFVTKQEVAGWPLLGVFARMAGTIFVNRASRMQVADANACIESAMQSGAPVLLFAEGTSSDGRTVLPFRPALLEPLITMQCPATPAAVSYALTDGSVADEVCYWGDMTLLPHLLNLLAKRCVHANVSFGVTEEGVTSRKLSSVALRKKVVNLR